MPVTVGGDILAKRVVEEMLGRHRSSTSIARRGRLAGTGRCTRHSLPTYAPILTTRSPRSTDSSLTRARSACPRALGPTAPGGPGTAQSQKVALRSAPGGRLATGWRRSRSTLRLVRSGPSGSRLFPDGRSGLPTRSELHGGNTESPARGGSGSFHSPTPSRPIGMSLSGPSWQRLLSFSQQRSAHSCPMTPTSVIWLSCSTESAKPTAPRSSATSARRGMSPLTRHG